MRKQWFVLGVVALAALLATSTFAANRGVSFSGIGFIHPWDPGPYPASMVWGMTDDGQTLLTTPDWGGRYATLTTYPGLEWSLVGGCTGFSISGDGSAIMASAPDDEGMLRASVWNGTENDWTPLPYPDGFEACGSSGLSFYDMGGNAEYATGLTWEGCSSTGPFFWNAATNTTVKYDPVVGSSSDSARGNAITDDGSLIVGWNKQLCGMWRGGRWDDGVGSWIDGLDANEPKVCGQSGDPCCGDRDCPEYVDDGWCDKTGVECVDGFCVGGSTPGASCTSTYYCEGYCAGGPNQGDSCRSDYLCPDTQVCVENHDFDAEGMKGEAFDVTSDGSYIAGTLFGM